MGVRFRVRTELGAWKEDFGSGENRTGCAEEGLRFGREPNCVRGTVIPWTIIYVYNVGMIWLYRLKCDSLEMFSMCKCIDVPEWTFMSA